MLTGRKEFLTRSNSINSKNFKKVFSEALCRRLHPKTALHSDQLAGAIGREGATVRCWMRGDNEPSGGAVLACVEFFHSVGDQAFIAEVFGEAVLEQRKRREAEQKALRIILEMQELAKDVA